MALQDEIDAWSEMAAAVLEDRLRHIVTQCVGWGPSVGPIAFYRDYNGWRVGNGTIITPWQDSAPPHDPESALAEIERYYGLLRVRVLAMKPHT